MALLTVRFACLRTFSYVETRSPILWLWVTPVLGLSGSPTGLFGLHRGVVDDCEQADRHAPPGREREDSAMWTTTIFMLCLLIRPGTHARSGSCEPLDELERLPGDLPPAGVDRQ